MSGRPDGGSFAAGRIRSFRYAFRGVGVLLGSQANARIHAVVAAAAAIAGFGFGLSAMEWCAVVLAVIAVFATEAINTAVERLADAAVPGAHPLVAQAKDVAAGAVLIAAVGAAVVGLIVFGPRLARLLLP